MRFPPKAGWHRPGIDLGDQQRGLEGGLKGALKGLKGTLKGALERFVPGLEGPTKAQQGRWQQELGD